VTCSHDKSGANDLVNQPAQRPTSKVQRASGDWLYQTSCYCAGRVRRPECWNEKPQPLLTFQDLRQDRPTGQSVSATDALAVLDQVIINILVANNDAHAKNYSLTLPVVALPHLAPLYDAVPRSLYGISATRTMSALLL
jgi:hypothetical protein